jgi:hypothetical protein
MFFFDLEATIIESWSFPVPINHKLVAELKNKFSFTEIWIFSFAIWGEDDLWVFNRNIKTMIENQFDVVVKGVITKEAVFKAIQAHRRIQMDEMDFQDFFGKEDSFLEWARINFKNEQVWLVDDMVSNMSVKDNDKNLEINFIRVP